MVNPSTSPAPAAYPLPTTSTSPPSASLTNPTSNPMTPAISMPPPALTTTPPTAPGLSGQQLWLRKLCFGIVNVVTIKVKIISTLKRNCDGRVFGRNSDDYWCWVCRWDCDWHRWISCLFIVGSLFACSFN
uniref:Uncharacterized protein n=1 Tax=Oryza rufipogon TaxID=4529 RepID=A0A0E0NFS9_ORYRU